MARTLPAWASRASAIANPVRLLAGQPVRAEDWQAGGAGANVAHVVHGAGHLATVAYRDTPRVVPDGEKWETFIPCALPGPANGHDPISRMRIVLRGAIDGGAVVRVQVGAAFADIAGPLAAGEHKSVTLDVDDADLTPIAEGHWALALVEIDASSPGSEVRIDSLTLEAVEAHTPGWPAAAGALGAGVNGLFEPSDDLDHAPGEPVDAGILFARRAQWAPQWGRLQQRACWLEVPRFVMSTPIRSWAPVRLRAMLPVPQGAQPSGVLAVYVEASGAQAFEVGLFDAQGIQLSELGRVSIPGGSPPGTYLAAVNLPSQSVGAPDGTQALAPVVVLTTGTWPAGDGRLMGNVNDGTPSANPAGWVVHAIAIWGP